MRRFFTRAATAWIAGVSLASFAATAMAQDDPAPAPTADAAVASPEPTVVIEGAAPAGVAVPAEPIAPGGVPYAEQYVPGLPGEPRRIGNGYKPGIPPQMIYYQGQQDLFYNYYAGPGANGQYTAGMYTSPHGWTPAHVGSTAYTYQPFYPHQYLAEHELWYTNGDRHTHVKYMHRGGQIRTPQKYVGDRWWPRSTYPTSLPYHGGN